MAPFGFGKGSYGLYGIGAVVFIMWQYIRIRVSAPHTVPCKVKAFPAGQP